MKRILLIIITFFSANLMASNYKLDFLKLHYFLNSDSTYTLTVTERLKVLSNFGANNAQKHPVTYYPDSEEFKLLKAFVIKPDGQKIPVDKSQVFTNSAPDDPNAPGFSNRMTTTVVYPNLAPKDSTYISYQITRKKPQQMGFAAAIQPGFGMAQRKQMLEINMPKNMRLRWAKNGPFTISDKIHRGRRIIVATITDQPEIYNENNMADLGNNLPYFIASSADSWNEIGAHFWTLCKDKITITPDIKKLANRLNHGTNERATAQAIHNWVAKNIHYIAVYMEEGAGVEPHKASEVLANGYGDCKDNTVLMLALLKAVGIEAYPVLVNVGTSYFKFPLPIASQFNHAMVYIPKLKTFSNPTSEFTSFGQLDDFTSNKFALIAAPKPFTLTTPGGSPANSKYISKKDVTINPHGDIAGKSEIQLIGRVNQRSRSMFSGEVPKLLATRTLEQTEGGVGHIDMTDPGDLNRDMTIHTHWSSPQAINIDKETYFEIPMGIDFKNPLVMRRLIQIEKRHYPTLIGAGVVEWNYDIHLPKKFHVTHLPKNKHFENKAGRYDSHYQVRHDQLMVTRKFVINKDIYDVNEYPQLRELIYQPVKDAKSVVSMKKN